MKSDKCHGCPLGHKSSGKWACYYRHPKVFVKHLDKCPKDGVQEEYPLNSKRLARTMLLAFEQGVGSQPLMLDCYDNCIKFHEGRTLQVTQSYTSNTITSVQKDNLLLEVYSL